MLLLASALLTSGLVTRVTQQAYDRFRVDYTGTAIPVLWDADEGTCTASTVVSAGVRDFACTITPTYATQTQADGSASDFQIDNTWPALYAAGTDCCREPVHLGTADFNNYIPTVTVQGTTTVTVAANCIGSVLTYTKVGERIIALDLPSNSPLATYTLFRGTPQMRNVTLAGTLAPNSPYSRTAALAASFGLARATEISSCAFLLPTAVVPNGREACRTYTRVTSAAPWPTVGNTSSTYGPPSPPPSPPKPPPSPPRPPLPPLQPYTAPSVLSPPTIAALAAQGLNAGSVVAIIFGVTLGAMLVSGYFCCKRPASPKTRGATPFMPVVEIKH